MSNIRAWRADDQQPRREREDATWRAELLVIANKVACLTISVQYPERFAEQKSERLRALARGQQWEREMIEHEDRLAQVMGFAVISMTVIVFILVVLSVIT
jgi:hypothetical protein